MAICTLKDGKTFYFVDYERTGEGDFTLFDETVYTGDQDGGEIQHDHVDIILSDWILDGVYYPGDTDRNLLDEMGESERLETQQYAIEAIEGKLADELDDARDNYASDLYDSVRNGDMSYSAAHRRMNTFERKLTRG